MYFSKENTQMFNVYLGSNYFGSKWGKVNVPALRYRMPPPPHFTSIVLEFSYTFVDRSTYIVKLHG